MDNDTRIIKLRDYLFDVVNSLIESRKYQINADMLSNRVDDFSLDKIPTGTSVSPWIIDDGLKRDVYSFRSRKSYSQDAINNLRNIGFFEDFEEIIEANNNKGVMPNIDGIEKIECLNSGTMIRNDDGKTAEFSIQIQITYRKGGGNNHETNSKN